MTGSTASLRLVRRPDGAQRTAILDPLLAFNATHAPPALGEPVAVLIDLNGATAGGLWGRFTHDWLCVELLIVPERLRGAGLGREIMRIAEQVAREENCVGIWLDTFEFQARGFYERLGFERFGELPDHPRGQRRLFLSKRLDRSRGP